MINSMESGSIIYDLAASQGGNAELTQADEIVDINGVKIIGEVNILNKLPVSASNLYSKILLILLIYLIKRKKL